MGSKNRIVAYLNMCKDRSRYNDILKKTLNTANIEYEETRLQYSCLISVKASDFVYARKIISSIPHFNASYNDIPEYLKH